MPTLTGEELRALRTSVDMSQSELASAIGMARETIGAMERGAAPIEIRTELAVRYVVEAMQPRVSSRERVLIGELEDALERGDLWVTFQPQIDVAARRIVGAEVLPRWTHPKKGIIDPREFIRAAEKGGHINKLTNHVFDRAIQAAAAVNDQGIRFEIAINLSPRLLEDFAFVATVEETLQRHGLAPELLMLEVTETAAIASSTAAVLDALRALRVQLAIDDYGTGLSTLEYLKRVPASAIKIDHSFVRAIDRSASDRLMVHSTIQLAHALELRVIADGVEQYQTLELLARMRCDSAQGQFIGQPVSFRALVEQLIEENSD